MTCGRDSRLVFVYTQSGNIIEGRIPQALWNTKDFADFQPIKLEIITNVSKHYSTNNIQKYCKIV